MKLLLIFFISIFLANIVNYKNKNSYYNLVEKISYYGLVIILVFFAGLRTRYNDTLTYIGTYLDLNETPYLYDYFKTFSFSLGQNPGFNFVNSLIKTLGFDEHLFIFLYAAFTISVYLWFIKKYTINFQLSIFFYFTSCYIFAFAGIKQAAASAIALIALDKAFHKKWKIFTILVLLAMTFHAYVFLIFLIIFIYNKKPWSKTTYIIIYVASIIGFFFPKISMIGSELALFFGDNYSVEELNLGKGVNIFRVLVYIVCFTIFYICRKIIYEDSDNMAYLFFHLHLIAGCFIFTALFGNQILIGRLPLYFNCYTCLNLTYAIEKMSKYKSIKHIKILSIILFFIMFYYEDIYLKPFDKRYQSISINEFAYSIVKIFNKK